MPVREVETWPEVRPMIEQVESHNEEIVQIVEAGNRILVISKRKQGRPPKVESRA